MRPPESTGWHFGAVYILIEYFLIGLDCDGMMKVCCYVTNLTIWYLYKQIFSSSRNNETVPSITPWNSTFSTFARPRMVEPQLHSWVFEVATPSGGAPVTSHLKHFTSPVQQLCKPSDIKVWTIISAPTISLFMIANVICIWRGAEVAGQVDFTILCRTRTRTPTPQAFLSSGLQLAAAGFIQIKIPSWASSSTYTNNRADAHLTFCTSLPSCNNLDI